MKIRATRDSVCMGDDCNAPNEEFLEVLPKQMLSDWMNVVADYVPNQWDVVWTVYCHKKLLGYIIVDNGGKRTIELAVADDYVSRLGIDEVFCRHYYNSDFRGKFSDLDTLIEKVKADIKQRKKK